MSIARDMYISLKRRTSYSGNMYYLSLYRNPLLKRKYTVYKKGNDYKSFCKKYVRQNKRTRSQNRYV